MTPESVKEDILRAEGYAKGFLDGFTSAVKKYLAEEIKKQEEKKKEGE